MENGHHRVVPDAGLMAGLEFRYLLRHLLFKLTLQSFPKPGKLYLYFQVLKIFLVYNFSGQHR